MCRSKKPMMCWQRKTMQAWKAPTISRSCSPSCRTRCGAALLAMLVALGVRTDLGHAATLSVLVKVLFTVTTVAIAAVYLIRISRPGGGGRAHIAIALAPLAAVVALAAVSLGSAPAEHWNRMIVGDQWL